MPSKNISCSGSQKFGNPKFCRLLQFNFINKGYISLSYLVFIFNRIMLNNKPITGQLTLLKFKSTEVKLEKHSCRFLELSEMNH